MDENQRYIDSVRRSAGPLESQVIDDFVSGRVSRRDFLRRGSIVGISIPVLSAIAAACGGANSTSSNTGSNTTPSGGGKAGATLKIAGVVPAAQINPITVADEGGLTMLCQTGEFLCFDNPSTFLVEPMLATKWTPNADGSVWVFDLRPNVMYNDGSGPMTADDVVYSFQQQCDPKGKSNALSVFTGLLVPDGVKKLSDTQVQFHLEAPNGNFPWLISSDNYNMIIVPKGTDFSKWVNTFIGTGPFKLVNYTAKVGATFVPNPHWWGGKVLPAKVEHVFYETQPPQITALESGDVDVVNLIVYQGAQSLFNNGGYNILVNRSSQHRELSMRCDKPPFTDKRVRQAVALTLNRPEIVNALFSSYGQVGNDSPFAPIFPSTDKSVPQRVQDVAKAKQLLAAAGHPNGISATLYTEIYQEIPSYAQIIKQAAAAAGIDITLKIVPQGTYYSDYWLSGEMSLVDYGHRGVPNVFLEAPLESNGSWNAAHFKDPTYDRLVKQYVAAVGISSQQQIAGQIERLLLDETPLVIAYFFDGLSATKKSVGGVITTAMGQIFLHGAYASA
jgi:peptide/nickel transport system substrate-binding protein